MGEERVGSFQGPATALTPAQPGAQSRRRAGSYRSQHLSLNSTAFLDLTSDALIDALSLLQEGAMLNE